MFVFACPVSASLYPATAPPSLLLLLLLDELHGGGGRRGGSHGPHHLDAVLGERREVETLAAPHRHLLQLFKAPQGELGRRVTPIYDTHPPEFFTAHLRKYDDVSKFARPYSCDSPAPSSIKEAALSSWGNVARSCCRTWSPWRREAGQKARRCTEVRLSELGGGGFQTPLSIAGQWRSTLSALSTHRARS